MVFLSLLLHILQGPDFTAKKLPEYLFIRKPVMRMAELGRQEALHSCCHSGVDQGVLAFSSSGNIGSGSGDYGILSLKGSGELLHRSRVGASYFNVLGEGGLGVRPRDGGDCEAGFKEGLRGLRADVARCANHSNGPDCH